MHSKVDNLVNYYTWSLLRGLLMDGLVGQKRRSQNFHSKSFFNFLIFLNFFFFCIPSNLFSLSLPFFITPYPSKKYSSQTHFIHTQITQCWLEPVLELLPLSPSVASLPLLSPEAAVTTFLKVPTPTFLSRFITERSLTGPSTGLSLVRIFDTCAGHIYDSQKLILYYSCWH